MDLKLLERRLLTRDSALITSSVSKCAYRLQQYLTAVQSGESTKQAKESLIREITMYKVDMSQIVEATLMCDRELAESKAIERAVEDDIAKAEIDINNLTKTLNEQKSIRKHKEECELVARLVNTLPAESAVGKDIAKAEDVLSKLREQSQATEYRVNMRTKQFQVLLQTIFDMKRNLEEDHEQQSLLAAVESSAGVAEEEDTTPAGGDSDAEENEENEGRRGRDDDGPPLKKSRSLESVEEEDLPVDADDKADVQTADSPVGGETELEAAVTTEPPAMEGVSNSEPMEIVESS